VVQQFLSLADGLARRFQQRFAGLIELDDARQVARFELIRPTAYLKPGGCTTLPASSVVSTPTPAWPGHRSASPSACGSPAWSVNSQKCKEIGSYARAQELLRAGHSYLDRSGDGIACKSLRKG
jgi:hypothetical protein